MDAKIKKQIAAPKPLARMDFHSDIGFQRISRNAIGIGIHHGIMKMPNKDNIAVKAKIKMKRMVQK